jgi:O-antigen ligase
VLLWAGWRAIAFVRWQLLAAASGLVVYWVLFYGLPPLLGMDAGVENRLDQMSSLSGREVIWSLAWQYMLDHPWLGIGPMHFAAILNPVAAHPHNAILQLAAEWGIPAALAAVALVVGGLVAFARPLRQRAEMLRLALLTSLLAACVQSMVDGVIVIPYTQTWLALIAGWALGVHWNEHPAPQALPSRFISSGLRMGGVLALGLLIWGVWPEILNRPAATAAYLEHHESLAPRYWAQGWIGKTQ